MAPVGDHQCDWLIIGGIALMLTGILVALAHRRNEGRTGGSDRAGDG